MTDCAISPWYLGDTCDHIYANCPNRLRSKEYANRGPGVGTIDPLDADTCGMCAHRWKRKNHADYERFLTESRGELPAARHRA
jgi:hypothetical protein